MTDDTKTSWKLKLIIVVGLSLIISFALWFAYEICFNFEEFTKSGSSTGKQKIYLFVILSIDSLVPFGRYIIAFIHVLFAYPFIKMLSKILWNFFKN